MRIREFLFITGVGLSCTGMAGAQSAVEHHLWQDARSFAPFSHTASAIVGPIRLSGMAEFATPGSRLTMTFGTGAQVEMVSEGGYWRSWDVANDGKQTAEMFRLAADPGALLNGNTLCGAGEGTTFVVFFESTMAPGGRLLNMDVFRGQTAPVDINSPGLCGTYSFLAEDLPVSPAPDGADKWRSRSSTNPLDDSKSVVLSLDADSGATRFGDTITFYARCRSNKTEVYVYWGTYLGDDSHDVYQDWKNVVVRVGAGKARTERWGVSTDSKATFAPGWGGDLLKELLDQDRLVLQTIPYNEAPVTAIFDISGLRAHLGELAATCGWSF